MSPNTVVGIYINANPRETVMKNIDQTPIMPNIGATQYTGAGSHFGVLKGIKIQHFFRPFLRLYSLELWASKYTPFLDVRQAKVTSGIGTFVSFFEFFELALLRQLMDLLKTQSSVQHQTKILLDLLAFLFFLFVLWILWLS